MSEPSSTPAPRRRSRVSGKPPPANARGRMTDKDLPLKLASRRLLWRMGCSTRLDVRLRGYVANDTRGPGWQEYTDLDVLGIGFTPAGQLHTTFADCRSSEGRVLERMFWVRGVADFVRADEAYIVRSAAVPGAARTLSSRLGVGVLAPDDLAAMEQLFPTELDLESGALACLFDQATAGAHVDAFLDADRKLNKLLDYLNFDYWVYEPYRNLSHLVAHLANTVAVLEPDNRIHRTLLYDCVWHYALAIARAVAHIRATRMGDVPTALRTYVVGGELALREKQQLARLLRDAGLPDVDREVVFPPYTEQLIQLVTRFLVRPSELADVLRYAEYLAVSEVNRVDNSVAQAFAGHIRPVAAKLTADVCGFLVTAAGLKPDFRSEARRRLVADLTGGSSAGQPAETEPPVVFEPDDPSGITSE
jgi:hypothetical protein